MAASPRGARCRGAVVPSFLAAAVRSRRLARARARTPAAARASPPPPASVVGRRLGAASRRGSLAAGWASVAPISPWAAPPAREAWPRPRPRRLRGGGGAASSARRRRPRPVGRAWPARRCPSVAAGVVSVLFCPSRRGRPDPRSGTAGVACVGAGGGFGLLRPSEGVRGRRRTARASRGSLGRPDASPIGTGRFAVGRRRIPAPSPRRSAHRCPVACGRVRRGRRLLRAGAAVPLPSGSAEPDSDRSAVGGLRWDDRRIHSCFAHEASFPLGPRREDRAREGEEWVPLMSRG